MFIVITTILFFRANTLDENEKADVKKVVKVINEIGEVKLNSSYKIKRAEKLYNDLSRKCQRKVENRKELKLARKEYDQLKAKETIELINQLGEISLENRQRVEKAQKSYRLLSDDQKKLVNNYEKLKSSEKKLRELKIEDVNLKIAELGTITLESEEMILAARKAYEELSEDEKKEIISCEILTSAEVEVEKLKIEKCIILIDELGTISLDSEEEISNIQKLYDSLSKESKEEVSNYKKFENSTEEYNQLVKKEEERKKTLNSGDSFATTSWEITYKRSNITAKLLPNSTNQSYFYYYAEDNDTFIDVVFQIKNVNTDILKIEDLVGNCEVEYNGSVLNKSYGLYTSSGSRIEKVYMWDGLDALDSTTLHVAITMPRELQSNDKPVKVRVIIAGEEKIINVR